MLHLLHRPAATQQFMLANATYHDDFWKLLVDVPRRDASELKVSQDVQISVPVAVAPAVILPRLFTQTRTFLCRK
jgi:hypothetical protein